MALALRYTLPLSNTNGSPRTLVNLTILQNNLKQRLKSAALELFDVTLENISAETPPKPELGDLAFPVSFELAKILKQRTNTKIAPRTLAEQLKEKLQAGDEVARVEVAGAGYLNIFFDRAQLLSMFKSGLPANGFAKDDSVADRPKQMVEHTSINPNKAAHIGHVRNAVLGDTFVRILKAANNQVRGSELHRQYGRAGCRCCCGLLRR